MSEQKFTVSSEEMLNGIREGRITEAGAAEMLERTVRAHSNEHARRQMHEAVDRAFGNGRQDEPGDDRLDEYGRLFPPSRPLGPPDEPSQSHFAPKKRTRVELPQKRKRASAALSDDEELFQQLYGYIPDPSYFED